MGFTINDDERTGDDWADIRRVRAERRASLFKEAVAILQAQGVSFSEVESGTLLVTSDADGEIYYWPQSHKFRFRGKQIVKVCRNPLELVRCLFHRPRIAGLPELLTAAQMADALGIERGLFDSRWRANRMVAGLARGSGRDRRWGRADVPRIRAAIGLVQAADPSRWRAPPMGRDC